MSQYEDAYACCPFYRKQRADCIVCEGMTEGGSITMYFERGEDKMRWVLTYCNMVKGCQSCPMWATLWRAWEKAHPDKGAD